MGVIRKAQASGRAQFLESQHVQISLSSLKKQKHDYLSVHTRQIWEQDRHYRSFCQN